jgi:hypothetical protein
LHGSVDVVGESWERLANQCGVWVRPGFMSFYVATQHHIPEDLNPQGYKVIHVK